MKLRIVIPSFGRLDSDLQAETGSEYPAFIQLGGKALYKHIVESQLYVDYCSTYELVLSACAPPVDFFPSLNVTRLEKSSSIGETIFAGLAGIVSGEAVVVNMADTLVTLDSPLKFDAIYTQTRGDLYRWTTVNVSSDGLIDITSDRDSVEPTLTDQDVCVGLFTFSDGCLLKTCLKKALDTKNGERDAFFDALKYYSAARSMSLQYSAGWFDCGHVDTYYESKLGYQNLRHFNNLAYDRFKGTVTKTSRRTEQYRHQVRWFKQVPDSVAAFLPRIFESSDSYEPFVTMELLSIPTLAEIFVGQRLNPGAWNGVVGTISHIIGEFGRYRYKTSLAAQMARNMYLDKTRQRLTEFIHQDPRALIYHVMVGGRKVNLDDVLGGLEDFAEQYGLLNTGHLAPIHGDFCFSNLLYDPKSRVVKMIDPRGEFGVPGIYGDPRYDLAKLAHSFSGGYDFIVSDRFFLSVTDAGEIDFKSALAPYHNQVRSLFEFALLGDVTLSRQVSAIQALLFLSMLPLHIDVPRRQLAMLATGLKLFATAGSNI